MTLLCRAAIVLGSDVQEQVCDVQEVLELASVVYDVPSARLACVGYVETRWKDKIGASGECGVTQVLPGRKWSCRFLRD
ncbi:MAG: hypothetical protein ACOYOB_19600, partial [Myxococcota bacterium]